MLRYVYICADIFWNSTC